MRQTGKNVSPKPEDQLEQLHAAWESARHNYGAESSECREALEKYAAALLEIGESPGSSESAAKAILGQKRQNQDLAAEALCHTGQATGKTEAQAARLGSGTIIKNRYKILRWIGQGGISRVHLVHDQQLGKDLALKIAHSNLKADKDTLEQFANESRAGSLLSHPNITQVYDSGVDASGHPFIVMEHIEGLTLAQILAKEKRLAPARALHIFLQLCDALEHAHRQGIIHSDLKPANIILLASEDDADFVKILDFGFSRLLNETNDKNAQAYGSDHAFGSPKYMSPEQCQGERQDGRSDLYSLACIMFEVLSGSPPFTGSIDEIMQKQISELPGRIECDAAEDEQLVKELEIIIFRALSKMPEERYQSMDSLSNALKKLERQMQNKKVKQAEKRGLIAKLLGGFWRS